jgi:hypothetical protein
MAQHTDPEATTPGTAADVPGKPRAVAAVIERPRDPAVAAATVMLRRVLDGDAEAAATARARGSVVALEVPGTSWVHPVADAWRALVLRVSGQPADLAAALAGQDTEDGDEDSLSGGGIAGGMAWCEFRRDGSEPAYKPDVARGVERLQAALVAGKSVVGVSHEPDRLLPQGLARAADVRIRVPPLDGDMLLEAVHACTGGRPQASAPDEVAGAVTAEDLRLARRPDDQPDAYLTRILRLATRRRGDAGPALQLADLHGMDDAVAWGFRLSRDLDDYRRGLIPWSHVDRGLLLSGPPGVGKTIFARALASTCRVPLIAASLAAWQAAGEGYLGDMLKAMRASFAQARAAAPAILFIDEVDGIGDRERLHARDRDYWTQVVNGLLEMLDGVQRREGVVVIGACNHPHRIDPAVLRSGRLDRHVRIGLPDETALARILRVHLGADLPSADLQRLALLGLGATGADAERWVRSARQRARHQGRPLAEPDLLAEVRGGAGRPPGLTRRVAIHEAGHALMAEMQRPGSLVKVDVRETGSEGGGTLAQHGAENRKMLTRAEAEEGLRMLLAGRAAEELLLGEPSSGSGGNSGSDLARATALAVLVEASFGLGADRRRLLWTPPPQDDASLQTALSTRPGLAEAVSAALSKAYGQAKAMLAGRRDRLERLADRLAAEELLTGDQARAVIGAAAPPAAPGADRAARVRGMPGEV